MLPIKRIIHTAIILLTCIAIAPTAMAQLPREFVATHFGLASSKINNSAPRYDMNRTVQSFGGLYLTFDIRNEQSFFEFKTSSMFSDMIGGRINSSAHQGINDLVTGGIIGKFLSGVHFVSTPNFRMGVGGGLSGYRIDCSTADVGFYATVGPALVTDITMGKGAFISLSARYDIPWNHYIPTNVEHREEMMQEKNAHWMAFNINLFSKPRLNMGFEYWKIIARNGSGLEANRIMAYFAINIFRFGTKWNSEIIGE